MKIGVLDNPADMRAKAANAKVVGEFWSLGGEQWDREFEVNVAEATTTTSAEASDLFWWVFLFVEGSCSCDGGK